MKNKIVKNLALILLVLFLASWSNTYGQTSSNGSVDFGFYQIAGSPKSSKFLEYKDYRENLVLYGLSYWMQTKLGFLEARARNVALNDQFGDMRLGKYGRYYLDLSWNQIPHFMSNHSRLFVHEAQRGVFTIADSIQANLQRITNNDSMRIAMANYLSQAQSFPLSVKREEGKADVKISPTRDVDVSLSYTNEKRTGYKPTGGETGTPGGFNVMELPEPIDYLTHQVDAMAQYSKKDWAVRANFDLSVFDNQLTSMTWDNTNRLRDTTSGTIRASRGRIGVAPDNWAQNTTLTGFYKFPYYNIQTRATLGYGIAKQDEKFLPFTINTAIIDTASQLVLPESSLNGEIRTLTGTYFVSARPVKELTLEGSFQYYEFDNQTEEVILPGYVADGDHTLDTMGRASLPYEYTKRDYGLKANVKPITYFSAGLGYKYERLSRDFRNVHRSFENSFIFSLDLFPVSWVTVRNSYVRSDRDAKDYNPEASEETYPEGEGITNAHLDELRRFDQNDRDQDKLFTQASIGLLDKVDLILGATVGIDKYPRAESSGTDTLIFNNGADTLYVNGIDTLFGLKESRATALSIGVNFYPIPRLSLYFDYTREFLFSEIRSRLRSVVDTGTGPYGTDSVQNDWVTKMKDLSDIFSVGFLVDLLPQKLSWQANYTYSYTRGQNVNFYRPGGPASGNAPNWPETKNEIQFVNSFIRYKISEQVSVLGEYRFEKYFIQDFALDPLGPQMLGTSNQGARSVFLGAQQPDYEGSVFGLKLSYQF